MTKTFEKSEPLNQERELTEGRLLGLIVCQICQNFPDLEDLDHVMAMGEMADNASDVGALWNMYTALAGGTYQFITKPTT